MLELVADFTDPGDLVLDPFCGSGTTGVACLRLGRRFIGVEKDATYAAVARERLEAEARGLTLRDARAGQTSIFDAMGEP
jgi:site-specific DNA-methyltransferase (adenine-specific)